MLNVLYVSLGVLIALALAGTLIYWYIQDITQKKHAVLRNFPIIGHLRYFFENLGEYFRQYFFLGDREEMPFNRATRGWVYRLAKNEGGILGFGSTYNIHEAGALIFVNAPFPVLEEEREPTPPLIIGDGHCDKPFAGRSLINVSGMSYGAISKPAVQALSRGAAKAGCWMDTGEGGLSPYHLEGGCDLIFQIGTAKYGVRDAQGPNYRASIGTVHVLRDDRLLDVVHPEKRQYLGGQVMTEAAILPGATRDLFVALGEPLGGGAWAVRVHVKPFVRWIWIGAVLMALGGFVTAADRRFRKRDAAAAAA